MVKVVATLSEFKEELSNAGGKLVMVDFFATWCGPCVRIAPKIEEWSGQHSDVVFLKIDVDANSETAQAYEIQAMPTFKFFKNGKEIAEVVGADPNKILDLIRHHK
mmetsp:Transcript_13996/g.20723  ORF Transcript_13996/g.20723 Transcript_13996/m.20723 type:complete len:106 (+) Transcript_13996:63-380(+)|eukprot:CAMPEP_0171461630 /NCGR_PEP_ID=MMETSP0945-20130129/5998_1 /TAXON_ID=109269 /ORGANISM="Vaucheria litorea, Strain CCMP2940" /LENGTH=105 /DNA_ID=CAMNT_0011988009 /DNA_START=39 /DNA_END=356 /DNA_ORIENTATION=+